jgi:hypothetical protein
VCLTEPGDRHAALEERSLCAVDDQLSRQQHGRRSGLRPAEPGVCDAPWNELLIYELHVGSFLFDRRNATRRGNFDTVIRPSLSPSGSPSVSAIAFSALRHYAERRGWAPCREYVDEGISGSRERRPALDRLMADGRRRAFGAVVVFRFDRFARSVSHLARALDEFRALEIEFVSLHEAVDTSTPMVGPCSTSLERSPNLSERSSVSASRPASRTHADAARGSAGGGRCVA